MFFTTTKSTTSWCSDAWPNTEVQAGIPDPCRMAPRFVGANTALSDETHCDLIPQLQTGMDLQDDIG